MIKHFYKTLLLALFLLILTSNVKAGEFLLQPAKVELFLEPGETAARNIIVKNRSFQIMHFNVEIEDIQGAEDGKESALLLGKEMGPYSLKSYLNCKLQSFSLQAGEEISLPIEISLPESIGPSGLYGAVLVSEQTQALASEADLNLAGRAGALFFVKVAGEIEESGRLESFNITNQLKFNKKTAAVFSILYRNQGNVHLNPYGVIEITNLFGAQTAQIEVDPYFVLPNSLRYREVVLQKQPGFGYYQARLLLNRGYDDFIEEAVVSFWVLPFEIIVAAGLVLALMVILLITFLKKRRSFKQKAVIVFLLLMSGGLLLILGESKNVLAEKMSSSNYKIQFDSVNVGGELTSTTNYLINTTVGESGTGVSDSTNYKIKAGYQQMQETYIAISAPGDISLSPNIKTTSGGASNGSGAATAATDSSSGYNLTIKAGTNPALQMATDSFADYTPAAAGTPDYTWAISVSSAEFGFTAEGADIVQKFKDNGAVCNAGALDTLSACWYNLATTEETIAQTTSANHPAGTATTLRFKAESGSSNTQTIGAYQASLTLTALAN